MVYFCGYAHFTSPVVLAATCRWQSSDGGVSIDVVDESLSWNTLEVHMLYGSHNYRVNTLWWVLHGGPNVMVLVITGLMP